MDEVLFNDLSVYENILLSSCHIRLFAYKSKIKKEIATYLNKFNRVLASKIDSPVFQLSGGEKQALALAVCLKKEPKLLLLDEFTAALDPKFSKIFMEKIKNICQQAKVATIVITHDLALAKEFGDRFFQLHQGSLKQLLASDLDLLDKLY